MPARFMHMRQRWPAMTRLLLVTPIGQQQHDALQTFARRGEQILKASRIVLIRATHQEAVVDEMVEAVTQYGAGDGEAGLERLKPPHAQEAIAQDQQCPPITQDRE